MQQEDSERALVSRESKRANYTSSVMENPWEEAVRERKMMIRARLRVVRGGNLERGSEERSWGRGRGGWAKDGEDGKGRESGPGRKCQRSEVVRVGGSGERRN